ncbi:MAG: chorion class high-cysteine HCB protein 13 [Lachnospira sp.]|nr:chorion class high-cysteine HCB protein 13 [Lachnospira sp.]
MSDLAATNCGGGCSECGGMSSCFWIIILLLLCGGCGCNGGSGVFRSGGDCDNGCSCIWIIILLFFCGGMGFNGGSGCGGCGCGC